MLIISKFHDYYDCIIRTTGVDKSVIYKRTTEEIDPLRNILPEFSIEQEAKLFNDYERSQHR